MKKNKLLKTCGAIVGVGAIAAGSAVALTSCKEVDHQDGFCGVNFRFSKDFAWAPKVSTHGEAGKVIGTFDIELYGKNISETALISDLKVSFIRNALIFTKFSCAIAPQKNSNGELKARGTISVSSVLAASDAGSISIIMQSSNMTKLPMNSREFTIWLNGN